MIVLIPAYEPDDRLVGLVRQLRHHRVVVVDDGSGPGYADMFAQVRDLGAEVVTYERNRGKGFALKTGFEYVGINHPGAAVVCADSDGQHTPVDIEAVAERLGATDAAMVLGVRQFTGAVPVRSRLGNSLTRLAFSLATRQSLADTQTGLRGYPAHLLGWLGGVPGDRFEYELRLLLRAASEGLGIEQVPISTIYLEHNASSHFRPLIDSVRVYGPLFAFAASSILAFLVDTIALYLLVLVTGHIIAAAVLARLLSATVNYGVNRVWVFGRAGAAVPSRASAPRYAALALGVFIVNVTVLKLLIALVGLVIVAKVLTELSLFTVSYLVQKYLVFPAASRSSSGSVRVAAPTTAMSGTEMSATTAAGVAKIRRGRRLRLALRFLMGRPVDAAGHASQQ